MRQVYLYNLQIIKCFINADARQTSNTQYHTKTGLVLALKPNILWEKDCAFCSTNAANSAITQINVEERKTVEGLSLLFNEVEGKPTREQMRIKNACPTDPQAEILVFDKIEAEYIIGAAFKDGSQVNEFREKFPHKKFIHFPKLFAPREDYNNW